MGSKVSRLCKDFKLKSSCVSNCCSDKASNNIDMKPAKHHHKHHHKEKVYIVDKDVQTEEKQEIAG